MERALLKGICINTTKTAFPSLPTKQGTAVMVPSDSRHDMSPPFPLAFFWPTGGLTFSVPCKAEGKHASQEEISQGVRWQEVTISAFIPFHTIHLWTGEEGTTSATGLCRWPCLGEQIHTQDETSPIFAQLWSQGHSSFNSKKFKLSVPPCNDAYRKMKVSYGSVSLWLLSYSERGEAISFSALTSFWTASCLLTCI